MRKAPRVVRGAETERIESDQAVHALGWEPVPVPMVVVMRVVVIQAQFPCPAPMPEAEENSLAAKPMMNKLSEAPGAVNTQIAYGGISGDSLRQWGPSGGDP